MGIFDFFKKKLKKDNRYNIDDDQIGVVSDLCCLEDVFWKQLNCINSANEIPP